MGWVIIGLGNPGEEYTSTRHNAGRMAVEYFAKEADLNGFNEDKKRKATIGSGLLGKTAVALVLPDTYMNKSGAAAAAFIKSQKAAEHMIVVYDDLDLPVGRMKISFDRSSGGHKGLESIIRAVKTQKFPRVRIGVSPATAAGKLRKPDSGDVNDFILEKFKASELAELKKVYKRAAEALTMIVLEGRERAMNTFNSL